MVVPLYNHAAFIAEAIDSILQQGAIVAEIIVIDDGSTDGSAAVMERLAAKDCRIQFSKQSNAGAHATINTALLKCNGQFLAILNSDDAFLPGRLTALVAALDAAPEAAIAASVVSFMDEAGRANGNAWYEQARNFYVNGAELGTALLNGNFIMTTSNLLFRRTALQQVGEFAALRYVHDLDWLLRALALGCHIVLVDQPLLRYRVHSRNTIAEEHGGVRAEWAMAAAAYLTTLWDRPDAPEIDWAHAGAAQAVLKQHQLETACAPCMAYLRRGRDTTLQQSTLLQDEAFKVLVRSWV